MKESFQNTNLKVKIPKRGVNTYQFKIYHIRRRLCPKIKNLSYTTSFTSFINNVTIIQHDRSQQRTFIILRMLCQQEVQDSPVR